MNWKRKNDKAMKKLFLFALFAALCCSCSESGTDENADSDQGQNNVDQVDLYTIHVPKKGTLAAVLDEKDLNAEMIVLLKITGELNDEDFITIQSMTNLIEIDLLEVNLPILFGHAFYGNKMIKKVTLPENLETIENSAFCDCESLTTIEMPAGSLEAIGDYAFSNCKSLTSIEIPSGVETIGNYAFNDCKSLQTVIFGILSYSLKTIGNSVFENCESLKTIIFGNLSYSFKTIGNYAFKNCESLTSIEFSGNSYTIGNYAFEGCKSLKTVTFKGVSRIGSYAFAGTAIATVDMSQCKSDYITIGERAFSECSKLQLFKIGADIPPRCEDNAFWMINPYSVLKVPSGWANAYKAATGWTWFASITGLDE